MAEGNGSSDPGPELFVSRDTAALRNARAQLTTAVPSDAGTITAIAGLLAVLVDRELMHPKRMERDKAAAKVQSKHAHEQTVESINQKYDAELAAAPASGHVAINAKREHELKMLEHSEKRAELAAKQAEELEEFRKKQAAEMAKVAPPSEPPPPKASGSDSHPPPGKGKAA